MILIHRLALRTLTVATIVLAVAVGNVFSQTPSQTTNPELAPAVKLLNERRSKEAVQAFKRAVEKNKLDADAWYYLGIAYLQTRDLKKASDAFVKTIKLEPKYAAGAHAAYGYALMRRGKLKDAKDEIQKALAADPKNVDALYTMSVISLRAEHREDAIKYADAVIALQPELAEAYLVKSQAYVQFTLDALVSNPSVPREERPGRYKAAADALEQYLKLAKDSAEKQLWTEQLATLRFYGSDNSQRPESEKVYRSPELTTKVRLLSKPEPAYTAAAKAEAVNGRVILRCVFAGDGTVKHLLVLRSLPAGLTEASIAAAKQIKFVPATINGKPVSMVIQLEYNFNFY